jgi:hypothetical protein
MTGHAHHFLSRLDRLARPHVELALSLYNDVELLRFVLHEVGVPEGVARVAVCLGPPEVGPHLVVTREGRFVTALGEGMRPFDVTVVSREALEHLGRRVNTLRERLRASESLTLGEYSRWVVTEYNWDVAEACREQHMEGEQMRKARDDRHRERGQIRQQDTVEQMKEAKTRVDAHRRANTGQGSNVKRDVIAWKEATNELKAEWAKFGASVRAAQQAVSSTEIRDALQASKKEKCRQVKQEETGLTAAYERLRGEILAKNKDLVGRVKKETADVVTAQHHARPARTRAHARNASKASS